jgi:hypothetical protein
LGRCIVCHGKARLVQMPLLDRALWLCRVHGPAQVIAAMRSLVAHG